MMLLTVIDGQLFPIAHKLFRVSKEQIFDTFIGVRTKTVTICETICAASIDYLCLRNTGAPTLPNPTLFCAFKKVGADGETRTLTILLSGDFESPASTIPPHRPVRCPTLDQCRGQSVSLDFCIKVASPKRYRNLPNSRFAIHAQTNAVFDHWFRG